MACDPPALLRYARPVPTASSSSRVAIVGAGIFGVTAALTLARRGHRVTLLDPGPLPHPLAESTDVSKAIRLEERGERVTGITLTSGATIAADHVVVAAGAWTPQLVPSLAGHLRSVGQPVFLLAPADPAPYEAARFPVFSADISRMSISG